MFQQLHPLIKQTQLLIMVSAEGELLRVNITPKAEEDANPALATPLSLLATPEELDAQLPEILAGYTDAHMDLRASLNNAVAQISEAKAEAGKKEGGTKPAAKKAEAKKPAAKTKTAETKPAEPDAPAAEEKPAELVDGEGMIIATEAELDKAEETITALENTPPLRPAEEQPAAPAEAAPPAEIEQAPEPVTPAAQEKDPNTIELF